MKPWNFFSLALRNSLTEAHSHRLKQLLLYVTYIAITTIYPWTWRVMGIPSSGSQSPKPKPPPKQEIAASGQTGAATTQIPDNRQSRSAAEENLLYTHIGGTSVSKSKPGHCSLGWLLPRRSTSALLSLHCCCPSRSCHYAKQRSPRRCRCCRQRQRRCFSFLLLLGFSSCAILCDINAWIFS